ncbi:unnamed protein product [Urochloa decumbens]|uniref:Late embryogenesis abundant protein LEA-2 subgroup domain-containing protein n=1 Tax=Urochloa decumbens TaxID=240449 RepID=A0ABC8YUP6_9POAL
MAVSAGNETLPDDKRGELILVLSIAVCGAVLIGAQSWWLTRPHRIPSFSAKLTDVGGLDWLHSPLVRPVFDLSLIVDNPKDIKMCRNNITATVFYGNVILGWGTVPDFCLGKGASTEMKATMSHADVMLNDRLRRSLASELRAGELEASVELRMLVPDEERHSNMAPESLELCPVHPGQGYALCRCTVLESTSFQN